jgi:flavin-dependent dehydrogenase
MPDGIAALRRIGVELGTEDVVPFKGIRFIDGEKSAEATFPKGHGVGIRRIHLHRILQKHAEKSGIVLRWQARVDVIDQTRVMVDGQAVSCRWIIGADGTHSRVRKWAGLQPTLISARRFGVRQHFQIQPWTDFVEVYWSKGCQAYVTPVGSTEVCVALIAGELGECSDPRKLFPALGRRLKDARTTTPERGALSTTTKLSSVTRGRIALIGDASGSVDAVTGDGLLLAFRQAVFLADALASNKLQMYESAHRRISRMPRLMARLLLLMDRKDGFRGRVISALGARPRTFNHFLAAHVGSLGIMNAFLEAFNFSLWLVYYYVCRDVAHKVAKLFALLTKPPMTAKKTISVDTQETGSAI